MVLHLLLQILCCVSIAAAADVMKGKCQTQCGDVKIPYPFGMGHNSCFRNSWFNITCNDTLTPPKPFLGKIEVQDISLLGQMTIRTEIGLDCYPKTNNSYGSYNITLYEERPFTFSSTRNKLTAIGCDTWALFTGSWGRNFTSACISLCEDKASIINGSCSGSGCCQSPIPAGVKSIDVKLGSVSNHSKVLAFNPCSFSFLVDQDQFNFSSPDLEGLNFWNRSKWVPVVLDWVAGNETCKKAQANKATYACLSENSDCYDSSNGPGYTCNCSSGFQGNPYVKGECQDIDECQDQRNYPCRGDCTNTVGSYFCTCPNGTHGDPSKGGNGCTKDSKEFPVLKVFLGNTLNLYKKRKLIHERGWPLNFRPNIQAYIHLSKLSLT